MWALGVIEMERNPELYQTFSKILDPRWSCSTVEICRSTAPELFFQSWSSLKHTLSLSASPSWLTATVVKEKNSSVKR
jgi:hypothetical protein